MSCAGNGICIGTVGNSSDPAAFAGLAWAQTQFGIAFAEGSTSTTNYITRMSATGQSMVKTQISSGSRARRHNIAWTGSQFGMVWHDYRNGKYEIYFARANSSGTELGSELKVADAMGPTIATSGSRYIVGWGSPPTVAIINTAGSKLHQNQITSTSSNGSPSLVWAGTAFAAAWISGSSSNNLAFAFLNRDTGALVGSIKTIYNAGGRIGYPSLVKTSSGFAVAYTKDYDLYFAKLDSSGNRIGNPVLVQDSGSDRFYYISLAWAGSGNGYGVAWQRFVPSVGDKGIFFQRLTEEGAKLGGNLTIDGTHGVRHPDLIWNGSEFAITWARAFYVRLGRFRR